VFSHNSEALDYIHDLIDTNKATIGLESVWYGDEDFAAPYPAAVVMAGGITRDYVATRTFEVILQVTIFVIHADMSVSHKIRTRQDMLFAESVVDFLHTDYTLGSNVINGYVASETPGVINRAKGNGVVSTSLAWIGRSRAPFGG
jgi:hypothetical protein